MRKFVLAALCGTLVLAGCSQDTPNPTEPAEPDASAAIRCIVPGFPITLALTQISGAKNLVGLYPITKPKPLALALARVAEVAALWTLCKPAQAQAKVAAHTNIVLNDFQNGQLIGGTGAPTAGRVAAHIRTMWQGVGANSNFAVGLFTPGTELLVKTGSGDGAVLIPDNGFTQPTLITIFRRPAEPNPFAGTGETVFPPFYEIIASNAGKTHYLANEALAVVGFCVDDDTNLINPAIAHIAVQEGDNQGGFEILEDAEGRYEELDLECPQFGQFETGSLFDGGLRSFASAAPRYLRTTAASLFLPTRAEAAATAVGKTGLGGLARSLSPFGVVENTQDQVSIVNDDPGGDYFYKNATIDKCNDGCLPRVKVTDPEDSPVDVTVTASLITINGTGTLGGTLEEETDEDGFAQFDNLSISEPGTYKLVFSAPGATPDTSGAFNVYTLKFLLQPTAEEGGTVESGSLLGEEDGDFDFPVVRVAIVNYLNNVVTDASDPIQLELDGEAFLSGDTQIYASYGIANFTRIVDSEETIQQGLSVSTEGSASGLRLNASVFGVFQVSSHEFNVDNTY